MFKRATVLLILALVLGGGGRAAAGVIVFDNFGAGNSSNTSSGWTISGGGLLPFNAVAAAFTPASSVTLSEIDVAIGNVTGGNELDLTLRADAGGAPGAVLESFHLTDQLGPFGNSPPLVVTSDLHPLLTAGTQYWLVASATGNTWDAWDLNSVGDTGPFAVDEGGGFSVFGTDTRGAFRVLGDDPAVVPEPSALAVFGLLAAGSAGYCGCRRRRRAAA